MSLVADSFDPGRGQPLCPHCGDVHRDHDACPFAVLSQPGPLREPVEDDTVTPSARFAAVTITAIVPLHGIDDPDRLVADRARLYRTLAALPDDHVQVAAWRRTLSVCTLPPPARRATRAPRQERPHEE